MFSRFSVKLRTNNTESMQHLVTRIAASYTPTPIVEEVLKVCDYSNWVDPHMPTLTGITAPRAFKVQKKDDTVRLFYKQWTRRNRWHPNAGLDFIRVPEMMQMTPVPADADLVNLDVDELQDTVRTAAPFFTREETLQEWDEWFVALNEVEAYQESNTWENFLVWANQAPAGAPALLRDDDDSDSSDEDQLLVIGGRRKRYKRPALEIDQMVAVMLDQDENGLPYGVAKILNIDDDMLTIHWWGTTETATGLAKWSPLQKRGTADPYVQELEADTAVDNGLKLTVLGRLYKRDHDRIMRIVGDARAAQDAETASE